MRIRLRAREVRVQALNQRVVIRAGAGAKHQPAEDGPVDHICQSCDFVLVAGAQLGEIGNAIYECPECRMLNEIRLV